MRLSMFQSRKPGNSVAGTVGVSVLTWGAFASDGQSCAVLHAPCHFPAGCSAFMLDLEDFVAVVELRLKFD